MRMVCLHISRVTPKRVRFMRLARWMAFRQIHRYGRHGAFVLPLEISDLHLRDRVFRRNEEITKLAFDNVVN